jgi:hypothetical protein
MHLALCDLTKNFAASVLEVKFRIAILLVVLNTAAMLIAITTENSCLHSRKQHEHIRKGSIYARQSLVEMVKVKPVGCSLFSDFNL